MWQIHNANRMERLADELAALLRATPASPFAGEPVLVQNHGLGRWIKMALAERLGAVANLQLSLPAAFLWRTVADQLGNVQQDDPLTREQIAWRIFDVLPSLRGSAGFEDLDHYLVADHSGRSRWRLAERLADVYDQYLVYRPDWIRDWERGEGEDWQARLWRRIADGGTHRVALFDGFLAAARSGQLRSGQLPARITLFGVSSLPPIQLEALHALSSVVDVHIFFLNPCKYYWGDIVSAKQRVRKLRGLPEGRGNDLSALLDAGQPLLASLGRQGQDFLRLLYTPEDGTDSTAFADPRDMQKTLLADLQGSLLTLDGDRAVAACDADGSLQVQVCHGPQRECQVLHDALLELFECHPDLEPRDIVVMAPDIDRYAPYIEGVFADQSPDRYLRWAITDRRADEAHPLLQLVESLLALPESRFTRSEVIGLLEVPALRRRFDIDAEMLPGLRRLIDESGARWGLDADDRAALDLPDEARNSWPWAEERMLLGYALEPREMSLYDGVAPLPELSTTAALAAGALSALLDRLRDFRERMATAKSLRGWQLLVDELLAALLAPDLDEEEVLANVRNALAEVVERAERAGFSGEVSLDVLRAALEEGLRQPVAGSTYLAGAVTFCSFQPMRSIPFRVVCLIGMNEVDFPRRVRAPDFDRMARARRPGDRSHRDSDRYAFLEALLSARDCLYISYVGRDIRDDSERQPSVVVSELLDWLDLRHGERDGVVLSKRITTIHPLQPFSPGNFHDGSPTWSYSRRWEAVCQSQASTRLAPLPLVMAAALPSQPADDGTPGLELETLVRFFRNPPRAFLQGRLGIYLNDDEADEDDEPFMLDGLAKYQLRDLLFAALEEGGEQDDIEAWIRASGTLPHGRAGTMAFDEQRREVQSLRERLVPYAGKACMDIEFERRIEVDGEPLMLRGWIDHLRHGQGRVSSRPGRMRLDSLFEAWIHFLVLVIAAPAGLRRRSVYVARDRIVVFDADGSQPMTAAAAADHLTRLTGVYAHGMRRPLPLFPESSWSYVESAWLNKKGAEQGLKAARKTWDGSFDRAGELKSRPYARVAGRGCELPLQQAGGQQILDELLEPMLDSGWFSDGR